MKEDNTIRLGGKHLVFIGILIIAVVFLFNSGLKNNAGITGEVVKTVTAGNGEVQKVTLSMGGQGYIITPSTLKEGVPVRMEVDMSTVRGCMQEVNIPSFGVKKYVTANDNIIEFTPTKKGTIPIRCSMNMGRGSFVVE